MATTASCWNRASLPGAIYSSRMRRRGADWRPATRSRRWSSNSPCPAIRWCAGGRCTCCCASGLLATRRRCTPPSSATWRAPYACHLSQRSVRLCADDHWPVRSPIPWCSPSRTGGAHRCASAFSRWARATRRSPSLHPECSWRRPTGPRSPPPMTQPRRGGWATPPLRCGSPAHSGGRCWRGVTAPPSGGGWKAPS